MKKIYRLFASEGSYVGATKMSLAQRFSIHKYKANNGCKSAIAQAIRCLGVDKFRIELLEMVEESQANDREAYWIGVYGSLFPGGFNLRSDGTGSGKHHQFTIDRYFKNREFNGEWRKKLSVAQKKRGYVGTKKDRERLAELGKLTSKKIADSGIFKGEGNPNAKVTNKEREEIWALYSAGGHSQESLAVMFGLKQAGVSKIICKMRRLLGQDCKALGT